jgi:hypothetical protein
LGGGPDVVFTDVYQYDSWVAKLLGIPVFAHMRGDFWTEFSQLQQLRVDQEKLISAVEAGWLKWLMNRSIGFAHTVLPICNWLAEQVKAHVLTKRIKVLYQPIQTNVWTTKDDDLKTELKHPAIAFPLGGLAFILDCVGFGGRGARVRRCDVTDLESTYFAPKQSHGHRGIYVIEDFLLTRRERRN